MGKEYLWDACVLSVSGMGPYDSPVSRSQLTQYLAVNRAKKRLSGEKVRDNSREPGHSKVLRSARVAASWSSTASCLATAMNLLHGDHAAPKFVPLYAVATNGSHDFDNPCRTLTKGRPYCLYTSRTVDVLGDRGSAEI